MSDTDQRLIMLSGEEVDEPGFFLGQSLAQHLDQQSRLGYIGFDLSSLIRFVDTTSGHKAVASQLSSFERDAGRAGATLPAGVVIDADSPNGKIWRNWLAGS